MRKATTFFVVPALVFCSFFSQAQNLQSANSFQNDLVKVISDYTYRFKNLVGEEIVSNPQSTDYRSRLSLKGAEECIVTKYSATGKEIYSFQAIMLRTEDFDEAAQNFKRLYGSVQNLAVNVGPENIVFKSDYEKPVEEMKFTSIVFKDGKDKEKPSKLRVELSLQNELLEWVVKVLVYDVEREDHERGEVKEQK